MATFFSSITSSKVRLFVCLGILSLFLSLTTEVNAVTYTFTTIDYPGSNSTRAYGINDHGQIVGFYSDGIHNHGFVLENGSFTAIDFPNAKWTEPQGINNLGQIVGHYYDGISTRGFLATPVTEPSANLQVRAEPNPATVGQPLRILADLENLGGAFSGRFAVYLVADGSVKEVKAGKPVRQFPAGFRKNNISVASTKHLPQYPPTVLFLVVIFNEATGAVAAHDTVGVGVGGVADPNEVAALEALAATYLEGLATGAQAAPARPSAAGKPTTTWGAIKAQR